MVSIDADPLDGPNVSTDRPGRSVKNIAMYVAGAGLFFALLTVAQNTTQPIFENLMAQVPGVNAGSDAGGIPFAGEI